ncbi:hypothetical protein E2C01_072367 [Portunus trituberculatus]|uniref:Uncharacterized protein n=1 Tax=Portunus trituberculatus TaxID=210409 RepID=A0A5B7IAJ2_PORTR|nr:hypothetical protein [Portunus trituberculatus]
MARTKSREGQGTDLPFNQQGKAFALTFNPYQKSPWKLFRYWYDCNPDLSSTNDNKTTVRATRMEGRSCDRASPLTHEQRIMILNLVKENKDLQDRSINPAILHMKKMAFNAINIF